jgi:hypothetical protein
MRLRLEPMTAISFESDIVPIFAQFRGSMLWRLDLTNYEDVKLNASLLYNMIDGGGMPPSPYSPIPADQIKLFQSWIAQGCQP